MFVESPVLVEVPALPGGKPKPPLLFREQLRLLGGDKVDMPLCCLHVVFRQR